jgi:hypothetical protein
MEDTSKELIHLLLQCAKRLKNLLPGWRHYERQLCDGPLATVSGIKE